MAAIFTYSTLNAIFFERLTNEQFLPVSLKISKNLNRSSIPPELTEEDIVTEYQEEDLDDDYSESDQDLIMHENNGSSMKLNKLEKEFLRQMIQIVPYLFFLFILFSISSKHAYVSQRLESNDNFKEWVDNNPYWKKVSFFYTLYLFSCFLFDFFCFIFVI